MASHGASRGERHPTHQHAGRPLPHGWTIGLCHQENGRALDMKTKAGISRAFGRSSRSAAGHQRIKHKDLPPARAPTSRVSVSGRINDIGVGSAADRRWFSSQRESTPCFTATAFPSIARRKRGARQDRSDDPQPCPRLTRHVGRCHRPLVVHQDDWRMRPGSPDRAAKRPRARRIGLHRGAGMTGHDRRPCFRCQAAIVAVSTAKHKTKSRVQDEIRHHGE